MEECNASKTRKNRSPPRLTSQDLTPQVPLAKLWEMLPTNQRLRALNALSKIVIKHRLPPEDLEVDHDYK